MAIASSRPRVKLAQSVRDLDLERIVLLSWEWQPPVLVYVAGVTVTNDLSSASRSAITTGSARLLSVEGPAKAGRKMQATKKAKYVTIKRTSLDQICSHSMAGQYDYNREMGLYRVNSGPMKDRIVLADHGFRWHGQNGTYAESWALLPIDYDFSGIKTLIEGGDLCQAQYDAYGDWVTSAPNLRIID
jgi:hypothetical protein